MVWLVSRKGIPMYGYLQKGIDMMVRTVRESIAGIRVIKALSKVEQEKEHLRRSMLRWFAAKAALPSAWASPTR